MATDNLICSLRPLVNCAKLEVLNLSRNKLSLLLDSDGGNGPDSDSDGEVDSLPTSLTSLDVSYNETLKSLEGLVSIDFSVSAYRN